MCNLQQMLTYLQQTAFYLHHHTSVEAKTIPRRMAELFTFCTGNKILFL